MKTKELIAELQQRDPEGDVQIYIRDGNMESWHDVSKVNGFINLPDSVIEVGEFRAGGGV